MRKKYDTIEELRAAAAARQRAWRLAHPKRRSGETVVTRNGGSTADIWDGAVVMGDDLEESAAAQKAGRIISDEGRVSAQLERLTARKGVHVDL